MPVEIAEQACRRRSEAKGFDILAQLSPVYRQGHVRAITLGRSTRFLGMIIGIGKGLVIQFSIGRHPAQHMRSIFDIGLDIRVGNILGR